MTEQGSDIWIGKLGNIARVGATRDGAGCCWEWQDFSWHHYLEKVGMMRNSYFVIWKEREDRCLLGL